MGAPPSLKPRPRLLLTPTCCTADTGSDTGATEATMVSATTDTVLATTARGLLRLSPRPRLTPTCCTADTVSDTGSAEAEPEAKADPYLLYGGYGYGHGLGYGYGYG